MPGQDQRLNLVRTDFLSLAELHSGNNGPKSQSQIPSSLFSPSPWRHGISPFFPLELHAGDTETIP